MNIISLYCNKNCINYASFIFEDGTETVPRQQDRQNRILLATYIPDLLIS